MNFLARKDRMFGPNHGVLFQAMEDIYSPHWKAHWKDPSNVTYNNHTRFEVLSDLKEADFIDENFSEFFQARPHPGIPRALGLSIDWLQKGSENSGERGQWAEFIHAALSTRMINNRLLGADVDLILLVDDKLYPEPFQDIDLSTTLLLDYSALSLDDAIKYVTHSIRETHQQAKPYVPSWKRDQDPQAGPSTL
jgi:hypothetical protein